jgi:2-dehydro-3-deoxygluconokinase
MSRIAAIGEVMIELAPYTASAESQRELKVLSFAGDTFNTAVYMARLGAATEYVTILGDDAYSDKILDLMASESIGANAVTRAKGRSPGLYMISNTPDGERQFTYWRSDAPARQLFSSDVQIAELSNRLADCDLIYVSGITLAIISPDARQRLGEFLKGFRANGGKVAFDSNYRPRLWGSKEEAQDAVMALMAHVDIALLTLDDEQLLWDNGLLEACQKRYEHCQLQELVLKRGAEDVIVITPEGLQEVPVPKVTGVVDTTGAGDTFNAGYLAARTGGASPEDAAREGSRCAGIVIRHRGGVIDRGVFQSEYNHG